MAVKKKKKKTSKVDPELLAKRDASLSRTHRKVIYLNDHELAAVDEYCRRFKITTQAALFRQAIMERVLTELEENHPTLF
ncbi:MAG: hypothetical protein MJZ16_11425 [Bacteroidales bacterium]|nr:hypothetical protein [Bacteroidales bacterium]